MTSGRNVPRPMGIFSQLLTQEELASVRHKALDSIYPDKQDALLENASRIMWAVKSKSPNTQFTQEMGLEVLEAIGILLEKEKAPWIKNLNTQSI